MDRKKLLDQQSHCLALANMHVGEMMYRQQQLNHPGVLTNCYWGPIQSYLAEQDHIVWLLGQLDDEEDDQS